MRTLQRGDDNHGNGSKDEEAKSASPSYDFDLLSENIMNSSNNGKPPPQPATAAVNSIHWDVEEGEPLPSFFRSFVCSYSCPRLVLKK